MRFHNTPVQALRAVYKAQEIRKDLRLSSLEKTSVERFDKRELTTRLKSDYIIITANTWPM